MESLQQEVVSSRTAHQQVADQLQEALNDKAMLEGQMDASLTLLGSAGAVLRLVSLTSCNLYDAQHGQLHALFFHTWLAFGKS